MPHTAIGEQTGHYPGSPCEGGGLGGTHHAPERAADEQADHHQCLGRAGWGQGCHRDEGDPEDFLEEKTNWKADKEGAKDDEEDP